MKARRFSTAFQPWTGAWVDALDGKYGRYRRYLLTGPQQGGKTLSGAIIPLEKHLFDFQEDVFFGLPIMDLWGAKWNEDLKPTIEVGPFKDQLPTSGPGSRGGGTPSYIQFKNGARLRPLSAGGSDAATSSHTARVLVATEIDKYDEAGKASRETNKLKQMEGRLRAFGDLAVEYLECTVSISRGRTWVEYLGGTASRFALICLHCEATVLPERRHLVGWQDADSVVEARRNTRWACPACGVMWSEEERFQMNAGGVLVHRKDTDPDSELAPTTGSDDDSSAKRAEDAEIRAEFGMEPRERETFSLRITQVNNLFVSAGQTGAEEWEAARAEDVEDAEKALCQYVHTLPYDTNVKDRVDLNEQLIIHRQGEEAKGIIPADTILVTGMIDIGMWRCHWLMCAWSADGTPRVFDYGIMFPESGVVGEDKAILTALREFREQIKDGWPMAGTGEMYIADLILVDSGYCTATIYEFCKESGLQLHRRIPSGWLAMKGYGLSERNKSGKYLQPKKVNDDIMTLGDGYHVSMAPTQDYPQLLMNVNADRWKTFAQTSLAIPEDKPGALQFYSVTNATEHLKIVRQILAEKATSAFQIGVGTVEKWEQMKENNHWGDDLYGAFAAAHVSGVLGKKKSKSTGKPRSASRKPIPMNFPKR